MAAEEITKYAINSTLGKATFKPLDEIITEKTNIKVQTVTVTIPRKRATSSTASVTIDEIDSSKSIIIPTGHVELPGGTGLISVTYNLSNTQITATAYYNNDSYTHEELPVTVQIITFGGNVS